MAKAQKRSGREPKKPKKAASKAKGGMASSVTLAMSHAPGTTTRRHAKKA